VSAAVIPIAESGEITAGARRSGDQIREAGDFPPSEGEAARLIRAHDWAATPLGHPSQWSASLRVVVRLMLANRFPHLLWWGPDYIQIYNDHYIPILGSKHPQQALGKPFRECWHEVFDILGPLVDKPFNGGPATWTEDIELIVRRHGFPEESHFIFAYSPVPDDSAPRGIGGVLATVHESTEKVVTERRVKILGNLSARVAEAKSEEQACAQAIEVLAQHPKDVPFALLYLKNDAKRELRLVSTTGVAAGSDGPAVVSLSQPSADGPWPLATALETETLQLRTGLASVLPTVPPGPWPDPPDSAAVVPIKSHTSGQPVGALVVGISACLRPDERYLNFLELVGSLVATAIGNARAYEYERRRAEALAEIDKVKTQFFSNVSHEFRTPLTLMLGPLEDALSVPGTPAKTRIGATLELTALRRESLERQQRQLEEEDRQKNEFLAMLAHELRNPLAPIRNAGELLARMFSDNTQAQGVVAVVRRQVAHLSHLVDDLLDVSRITQRKIELRKETIEVAEVIRQAVETVEPVIRERGHDLQIQSNHRPLPVYGDVSRLVQCVVNLLTNAAKYTEAGGRIHVTSRKQGQAAVIEVADNGMGIPQALITRVFDLFVQSERTLDRSQGGLGIGLSVVRRLVEMHGGSVAAESEGPGRGSTFSIRLPLSGPPVHKSADCADSHVRPQRILVVDDNADAAVTLSMMLNLDGHESITAYTARDALQKAESFQPSVILLDIGLPGMDGYEIARRIRALPAGASIRLVALTGYGQPEDRARALHEGFDAHLVKPMIPTELRKIIATASA
jgi:signal transduction histidine kinase